MKKLLALALALLMIVGCCATLASCKKDEEGDTIKIGLSGPLTGDASIYGTAVKNSAQMAIDEINAAGGLNGIKFELLSYDDQADPSKVATNYADMVEKGMHIALGCVTTGACLEFADLSKDEVFFLTPSASANDVPKHDNAYQMCFADGNQGAVAADYVNSLGLDTVGVFYESNSDYSKGIYEQFIENLNSDIEVVVASYQTGDSTFTTQVDQLKNCDFIFMPIYYTPASNFMLQAIDKVADDAVYYGCDGLDGIESVEGFSTIPQRVTMLSHFNAKSTADNVKTFVEKYTEEFGADTLNQFGASAYDCVYAIYEALEAAIEDGEEISTDMTSVEFLEILRDQFNGDFKFSGVTGSNITWSANGFVNKQAVAYVIKEETN